MPYSVTSCIMDGIKDIGGIKLKRLLFLLMAAMLLAACSSDEPKKEETPKAEETPKQEEVKKEDPVEEPEVYETETEINFHSGSMTVSGRTNLPEDEEVIISVSNKEIDYVATDTQTVDGSGIYSSAAFSKQGEPLPAGEYTVKVKSKVGDKLEHEELVTVE